MEDENSKKNYQIQVAQKLESVSTWTSGCDAIKLWKGRPNLVNRRLCGCSIFWSKSCINSPINGIKTQILTDISREIIDYLSSKYPNDCVEDLGETLINHLLTIFVQLESGKESQQRDVNIDLQLRKLLPRSTKKFKVTVELVASMTISNSDGKELLSWFIPLFELNENEQLNISSKKMKLSCLISLSYGVRYQHYGDRNGCFELLVSRDFQESSSPSGILCANLKWLQETLMTKFKNWSESFADEKQKANEKKLQSLSLVEVEAYSKVYNTLKEKYAKSLCEAWEENTDPQKFVFEDISIAAYLIVLWEEERKQDNLKEKQSFIDLGCGNGLLVYLLIQEGYKGKGVDIRRRNIWSKFGENTVLLEQPLHPNSCKFEDADWLIGNHSDELTPWIPVIAARSSYRTNYFLLPCCFHDFTRKFQKNCHDSSQYQTYLEYIREIGEACGFVVEEDIQRIPSTKRTCHIARKRTYDSKSQSTIDDKIQRYLESQGCDVKLGDSSTSETAPNASGESSDSLSCTAQFEPREAKEKVRNCTQIDKQIRDDIIKKVSSVLLDSGQQLGCDGEFTTSKGLPCSEWNCGGSVSLESLASLLDADQLQKLKSQCGGLQTLIRNHGYIFRVEQGHVRFRNYKNPDDKQTRRSKKAGKPKNRNSYKMKSCWFHYHHPHGCLLPSNKCQFAHSETELVSSTV